MSALFGGSQPQAQPVPISPVDDGAAQKKRQEAEQQARLDSSANGRRSTIVGGARADLESRTARRQNLG